MSIVGPPGEPGGAWQSQRLPCWGEARGRWPAPRVQGCRQGRTGWLCHPLPQLPWPLNLHSSPGDGTGAATPPTGSLKGQRKAEPGSPRPRAWRQRPTDGRPIRAPLLGSCLLTQATATPAGTLGTQNEQETLFCTTNTYTQTIDKLPNCQNTELHDVGASRTVSAETNTSGDTGLACSRRSWGGSSRDRSPGPWEWHRPAPYGQLSWPNRQENQVSALTKPPARGERKTVWHYDKIKGYLSDVKIKILFLFHFPRQKAALPDLQAETPGNISSHDAYHTAGPAPTPAARTSPEQWFPVLAPRWKHGGSSKSWHLAPIPRTSDVPASGGAWARQRFKSSQGFECSKRESTDLKDYFKTYGMLLTEKAGWGICTVVGT